MALYVFFCDGLLWMIWKGICRAFMKKSKHMTAGLTKCHVLVKWLCISLIIVLEISHMQILEASQESPRIGLVLEAWVAIVELFTDCRRHLKYLIPKWYLTMTEIFFSPVAYISTGLPLWSMCWDLIQLSSWSRLVRLINKWI